MKKNNSQATRTDAAPDPKTLDSFINSDVFEEIVSRLTYDDVEEALLCDDARVVYLIGMCYAGRAKDVTVLENPELAAAVSAVYNTSDILGGDVLWPAYLEFFREVCRAGAEGRMPTIPEAVQKALPLAIYELANEENDQEAN